MADARVGAPVIKPIYGAASLGVVRVNSLEDLEATYVRVQKEMSGARIVAGALTQADEAETEVRWRARADPPPAAAERGRGERARGERARCRQGDAGSASSWIKTTLMLEEYLDGPEVDVDVIFSEGEAVYGAITDNWPTVEPYFNETGSNCPSVLPAAQQRELMDLAVASVHSLGFQMARPAAACLPAAARLPATAARRMPCAIRLASRRMLRQRLVRCAEG